MCLIKPIFFFPKALAALTWYLTSCQQFSFSKVHHSLLLVFSCWMFVHDRRTESGSRSKWVSVWLCVCVYARGCMLAALCLQWFHLACALMGKAGTFFRVCNNQSSWACRCMPLVRCAHFHWRLHLCCFVVLSTHESSSLHNLHVSRKARMHLRSG